MFPQMFEITEVCPIIKYCTKTSHCVGTKKRSYILLHYILYQTKSFLERWLQLNLRVCWRWPKHLYNLIWRDDLRKNNYNLLSGIPCTTVLLVEVFNGDKSEYLTSLLHFWYAWFSPFTRLAIQITLIRAWIHRRMEYCVWLQDMVLVHGFK